ncbi:hypothetical protein LCGC14_1326380 [marine sediment metagenome]|uniref:Uncharacterized protein n=1 Tax=marine sediment metagenome TaxID=412755 RepID=A0A0F9MZ04_9ZZZZ
MARLGFNIGRLINKGTQFAAGAGAFDGRSVSDATAGQVGAGNIKRQVGGVGLLDVAKDIVGGSNRAGTGASLSDRLRGGLSAVSPRFASAENLRSTIQARGVTNQLNTAKLAEVRKGQEQLSFQDVFGTLEKETQDLIRGEFTNAGLIEKDADGNDVVTRDNLINRGATFFDDVNEKKQFANAEISGVQRRIKENDALREKNINDIIDKEAKTNNLDPKLLTPEARKSSRDAIEQNLTGQQFPELNSLNANNELLNEKLTRFQEQIVQLDASQTTALQASQIALNEAKAQAALDPASSSFDAGTYATLANSDDPAERKLAQDALKFKRKPEGEARRDLVFSTIAKSLTGEEGLQRRAQKSAGSIPRLNKMIELAQTNKVTGQGGKIKSGLAGWAELIGVSEESLKLQGFSDSQLFQQLGRLIVGPLRTEIIGPGQVTDNEQNILVKAGGAGGLTKGAAIELLQEYITQNQDNINFYNENVDSLIELDSKAGSAFKKIQVGDRQRGIVGRTGVNKTAQDFFNNPEGS